MYVDFSIPVNPKLPAETKRFIALMDEAFKINNEFEFDKYQDAVDSDLRGCCVGGLLTDKELYDMRRRFGWSL